MTEETDKNATSVATPPGALLANAPVDNPRFTDEEVADFVALGAVLRKIHNRLESEGYTIERGRIYKKDTDAI